MYDSRDLEEEGNYSRTSFQCSDDETSYFTTSAQSDAKRCIDMACVTPFVPSFSSSPVVLNVNLRSLTNDRRSWISMTRFKLFLVLVRLSLVTGFLLFCFILRSFLTLFSNLLLITHRACHISCHFSNNFEL